MNDDTDNDAEYDYDNCDVEDYIMDGYTDAIMLNSKTGIWLIMISDEDGDYLCCGNGGCQSCSPFLSGAKPEMWRRLRLHPKKVKKFKKCFQIPT